MVTKKSRYEFEGYTLFLTERLLTKDGKPIALKPKVFETLLTLVRHHQQQLSKEFLMQSIWGGRSVEEGNLSQYIFLLRKIFGESPSEHRFIVTIPGEGYRFVAKVREIVDESLEDPRTASTDYPIESLAILPMRSLTATDTDSFLGLAVADSLITKLSGSKTLSVRSTAAILKYAKSDLDPISIGQELRVDAIVSGTMIEAGEKLILNIQLTTLLRKETLWADRFVLEASDFLGSHERIVSEVAKALTIELHPNVLPQINRMPKDQEVYQTYLKGRYFWEQRTEETLLRALSSAREVLAADANFPLASVAIADSYLMLGEYLHLAPDEAFPAAEVAASEGLKIEPALSEGYASLAEYYFYYRWDWEQAESYYRQSLRLNPNYPSANHWYAWFLLAMRRFEEATDYIERAQRLDPSSLILSTIRGMPFYYARDYERAINQFQLVREIDPDNFHACYYLACSLVHAGDPNGAISQFERIVDSSSTQQSIALLGYCYGVAGDKKSAEDQLARLDRLENERYVSPCVRSFVHAGLNEIDEALSLLEKAHAERAAWMVWLSIDPFYSRLHKEPRFIDLKRGLKLA